MSGKRILCYSPYNVWELHGLWETTILHSLRLRGHEITYIMCDGLYRDCDIYWAAIYGHPRPENACLNCQHRVSGLMMKMNMPYQWLGRYLLPEEFRIAADWAASLSVEAIGDAVYGDWPIGEWVAGSVHSHFRINRFDFTDPVLIETFRNYVYSGLISAFGMTRLLDSVQPEIVFLFNGRMASPRIMFELTRKRNIDVYCHERGYLKEAISINHNLPSSHIYVEQKRFWMDWESVPLTREQLQTAIGYMLDREHGRSLNWTPLTSAPAKDLDPVRLSLRLRRERPVWVLFPSSEDEISTDKELIAPFSTQQEWIEKSIEFAALHQEIDLVIRVHPNVGAAAFKSLGIQGKGSNDEQVAYFQALMNSPQPDNVRIVGPDDPVSSYSLMNLGTVGLTLISTTALEMACKGKASVVGVNSFIAGTSFVQTLRKSEDYFPLLEKLLPLQPLQTDPDHARLALRFVYFLFYRWNLPFGLVRMPDPHTGELAYQHFDELLAGRHPHLDRICRILLGQESVTSPPNAYEGLLPESEERAAFFQEDPTKIQPPQQEKVIQTPISAQSKPKLSVVIPCFNYGRYLAEAVHSLLAQSFTDFEIIIVNDGSSDDSAAVAQRLLAAYPDRPITFINQPNSGQPAIPRNRGITQAKGEYILCLDADDMLATNCLETCVACLDQNSEVSIAYPRLREIGGSELLWAGQEYQPELLLNWNFIPTAAMFRRTAWEAAGGYATNVISHEDWDFWIACSEKGHFGKLVNDATFYYRIHEGSLIETKGGPDRRMQLKAQVMLNHSRLYSPNQILWAKNVLRGDTQALSLTIDPSQMPQFENDELSPDLKNLLELWVQSQINPRAWLEQRRSNQMPNSIWLCLRSGAWEICQPEQADVFDWWPDTELPESLPERIWIPTVAAQAQLELKLSDKREAKLEIVPRFISDQTAGSGRRIDTEYNTCLLAVLTSKSNWQEMIMPLLTQKNDEQGHALVLIFIDLSAEASYVLLSNWLESIGLSEEDLPEIVLLDAEDNSATELLQQPVDALLLDLNADLSQIWLTTAWSRKICLLSQDETPEIWSYLFKPAPQLETDKWKGHYRAFQPKPEADIKWNQHVWELMNQIS